MDFHTQARCERCAFFFGIFEEQDGGRPAILKGGQCRQGPPPTFIVVMPRARKNLETAQMEMVPFPERMTTPPIVMPDFWCGSYQPRVTS